MYVSNDIIPTILQFLKRLQIDKILNIKNYWLLYIFIKM